MGPCASNETIWHDRSITAEVYPNSLPSRSHRGELNLTCEGFSSPAASTCLGYFGTGSDNSLRDVIILLAELLVFNCAVGHTSRGYFRSIDQCREQLQNFSVERAECYCCTVKHVEAGDSIVCDKDILRECIRTWYGSEEEFEASVKTGVFAALVNGPMDSNFKLHALPKSW